MGEGRNETEGSRENHTILGLFVSWFDSQEMTPRKMTHRVMVGLTDRAEKAGAGELTSVFVGTLPAHLC